MQEKIIYYYMHRVRDGGKEEKRKYRIIHTCFAEIEEDEDEDEDDENRDII